MPKFFSYLAITLSLLVSCSNTSGNDPEAVARGFIKAMAENRCQDIVKFVAPDKASLYEKSCNRDKQNTLEKFEVYLQSANVTQAVVRDVVFGGKQVTLLGEFQEIDGYHIGVQQVGTKVLVTLEQANGRWYVDDYDLLP